MARLQFRVLYKEFFFRLIDREVLSASAQGDASKLLGRLAGILVLVSIPFTFSVINLGDSRQSREAMRISAWGAEHALIATTMLIVGLFSVLSWDAAYPNRRDALILAPLPVRASTIFLAKIAALSVGLCLGVVIFNAACSVLLPMTLAPRDATPLDLLLSLDFYRVLAAYWVTMLAGSAFILCCVLTVQGIAGQLPRRMFLRISAVLQLAAFCVFLTGYFLEPSLLTPEALSAAQNQQVLAWLPSYWFLGLFQQLAFQQNGSAPVAAHAAVIGLASRAWMGFGVAITTAAAVFVLSYFRTLRKIVEEPDILPNLWRFTWLPRFGNGIETAITQFSIRSVFRSRQHRVLLSFYAGIGFAIVILYMKTPIAQQLSAASAGDLWHQASLPLLASSFVMMCAWILGVRIVFAIPLELRANWVFRVTQVRPAIDYFAGRRRAAYALALGPIWCLSGLFFVYFWPLRQALEHMTVLVLVGMAIIEVWLSSFNKIPFACSYRPGKSNLHITFLLCLMLGLNATLWSAEFERRALANAPKYLWMTLALAIGTCFAWWRRARTNVESADVQFEEEMPPAIMSLGLSEIGIQPASKQSDEAQVKLSNGFQYM